MELTPDVERHVHQLREHWCVAIDEVTRPHAQRYELFRTAYEDMLDAPPAVRSQALLEAADDEQKAAWESLQREQRLLALSWPYTLVVDREGSPLGLMRVLIEA